MFKIGEFSRLGLVSVKALRFYDELGLLKPVRVDDGSGYRYYRADQLPRLNRILALKDLGFTLEQIAPALAEGVSPEQIRGMLRLKQTEIRQRMEAEQEILARVEARLQQIEREGVLSAYEVVIKKVEKQRVASIRKVLPQYSAVGSLMGELYRYLGERGIQPAGPCIAVWYDPEYKESNVDGEACIMVAGDVLGSDRVKVHELPGVETMASTVHHGSYSRFPEAYTALMAWIEANRYTIAGPGREVYLASRGDGNQHDESCVTEIQFPVAKVG